MKPLYIIAGLSVLLSPSPSSANSSCLLSLGLYYICSLLTTIISVSLISEFNHKTFVSNVSSTQTFMCVCVQMVITHIELCWHRTELTYPCNCTSQPHSCFYFLACSYFQVLFLFSLISFLNFFFQFVSIQNELTSR